MKPVIARFRLAIWVTSLMLATAATSLAQIFGYVTDNMDRTVSVIDTNSNTIVGTVSVGYFPVACGDFLTPALIFADGFEPGDPSAWSAVP